MEAWNMLLCKEYWSQRYIILTQGYQRLLLELAIIIYGEKQLPLYLAVQQ